MFNFLELLVLKALDWARCKGPTGVYLVTDQLLLHVDVHSGSLATLVNITIFPKKQFKSPHEVTDML